MPQHMDNAEQAVDRVLELTGGEVRLGLPLGLGKPNRFVNALYQRVKADPSLSLEIYTADVVPLGIRAVQKTAGLEKELEHANVLR